MNIKEIAQLPAGTKLFVRTEPSEILWTEDVREELGVVDGLMRHAQHTAAAVTYRGNSITYRSCWPRPHEVELAEITMTQP